MILLFRYSFLLTFAAAIFVERFYDLFSLGFLGSMHFLMIGKTAHQVPPQARFWSAARAAR